MANLYTYIVHERSPSPFAQTESPSTLPIRKNPRRSFLAQEKTQAEILHVRRLPFVSPSREISQPFASLLQVRTTQAEVSQLRHLSIRKNRTPRYTVSLSRKNPGGNPLAPSLSLHSQEAKESPPLCSVSRTTTFPLRFVRSPLASPRSQFGKLSLSPSLARTPGPPASSVDRVRSPKALNLFTRAKCLKDY
ncbi:hypothetical protein KFK09_006422 [Dendrobium nobile]|uniref:Uncharacterized protein n=1 Tax=Dendrobium nobile TaxID=94219 RepID=A0A8T3BTS2_DENNO|nr:hypothetical protein KFK09_006422 [Dendrobium nobile]